MDGGPSPGGDTEGRVASVLTSRAGESPQQTVVRYEEDSRRIDGDKQIVEALFAEDGSLRSPLPSSLSNPLSATNDSSGIAGSALIDEARPLVTPEPQPLEEIRNAIAAATPSVVTPIGVKDLPRLAEQMVVAEVTRLAPTVKVNGNASVAVPVIDSDNGKAMNFNPYVEGAASGLIVGVLSEQAGGGDSLLSRAFDALTDFVGGAVQFVRDTVRYIVSNPVARLVLSAGAFVLSLAVCAPPATMACLPVAGLAVSLMAGEAAATLATSIPAAGQSCSSADLIQCGLAIAESAIAIGLVAAAIRIGSAIIDVYRAQRVLAWAIRSGEATSIASGNVGTARSQLLAALRFEQVAAREVSVVADGTRARIDLVTESLFGRHRLIEVKNGAAARFTTNQQVVYPMLQSVGAYFPSGILNNGAPQTLAATVVEIQHWGTRIPLALP